MKTIRADVLIIGTGFGAAAPARALQLALVPRGGEEVSGAA